MTRLDTKVDDAAGLAAIHRTVVALIRRQGFFGIGGNVTMR